MRCIWLVVLALNTQLQSLCKAQQNANSASEIQIILRPSIVTPATGGVAPGANIVCTTLVGSVEETLPEFRAQTESNPGGDQRASITTGPLIGTCVRITAGPRNLAPSSASGIFTLSAVGERPRISNLSRVIVPPQSFIQVLYGESLQQKPIAKVAVATTIRNRLNRKGFANNNPYNGLIFTDVQFDSVRWALFPQAASRASGNVDLRDYDQDVAIAARVFGQTQPDITGDSVMFRSPTKDEMGTVLGCLARRSQICVIGGFYGIDGPRKWQIVIVEDVEANTNRGDQKRFGQPAFIFARPRKAPSDPSVVKERLPQTIVDLTLRAVP
jgi:hypothetical protein